MPAPTNDDPARSEQSATDDGLDLHAAEAERYEKRTSERTEMVRQEQIVELLTARQSTGRNELEQRVAASSALTRLAQGNPGSLEEFLPVLIEELRRETDSGVAVDTPEIREKKRALRTNLVETVSRLIINTPETTVGQEAFTDFIRSVDTDLDDGALRVASQALFASADERSSELATAAELLDELLTVPDDAVQTWAGGMVGRVAAAHPDAVASTATNLRCLLTHKESTVQHNAVEALAAFVGSRPDVVAPAADMLRDLLDHEEVAVQHNAAGILAVLAEHEPEAVIPAVEDLYELRDHDEEAIRRIATEAISRLAHERPEAVTDCGQTSS